VRILPLAEASTFGVVAHIVVPVVSGDPEFGVFDDGEGEVALVEDGIDEAQHCLLDGRAVVVVDAVLVAGGAVHPEDVSVLVVEEIAVAVFTDVEEPLGTTHSVIETQV
jgi:hypothetical protein